MLILNFTMTMNLINEFLKYKTSFTLKLRRNERSGWNRLKISSEILLKFPQIMDITSSE